MFFSKRQKEIVRAIKAGKVFDILSYVKTFQPERILRCDWSLVQLRFRSDPEAVNYYCPRSLRPSPANLLPEEEYQHRVTAGQSPETYVCFPPKLEKACSQWEESVFDSHFSFDLYQGVRVLDSFDDLVDFLTVWQFLRDAGLVLEVPQTLDKETAGLFFERSPTDESSVYDAVPKAETICFPDRKYLQDECFQLSKQRLMICRGFLEKRLYPSPRLNLFIQNKFRTHEEVTQSKALTAAWAAVIVSVLAAIFQFCS